MQQAIISFIKELTSRTIDANRIENDSFFYKKLNNEKNKQINLQFNIKNTIENYSLLKFMALRGLDFITSEINCYTAQIHSGQCSIEEYASYKAQVEELEIIKKDLCDRYNSISKLTTPHIQRRSFLPLLCLEFKHQEPFALKMDFDLFFLQPNEVETAFHKLILDKDEYAAFQEIFLGTPTPSDLISMSLDFLGVPKQSKIAICQYEPRFNGFIIHTKEDAITQSKLRTIAQANPSELHLDQDNNFWIYTPSKQNPLLDYFDVWIDSLHCVYYIKSCLYPIKPNTNIKPTLDLNPDYLYCIYFDRIIENQKISINEILNEIQKENPFENPKCLEIFKDKSFIKPSSEYIETHAEFILTQHKVNESTYKLCLINSKSKKIHLIMETTDYYAKFIQNLYRANLQLLRIIGFKNILESI